MIRLKYIYALHGVPGQWNCVEGWLQENQWVDGEIPGLLLIQF